MLGFDSFIYPGVVGSTSRAQRRQVAGTGALLRRSSYKDVPWPNLVWAAEIALRGSKQKKKSEHMRFGLPLLIANILNIMDASTRSSPCWKT